MPPIMAFRYGWAVTGISGYKLLSFLLKPSEVSALSPSQERALYLPVNEDGDDERRVGRKVVQGRYLTLQHVCP